MGPVHPGSWTAVAGQILARAPLAVGLALACLPLLAIVRGAFALMEPAYRPATANGWIGVALAFVSLLMGSLAFLYSVKYYLATVIALLLAFLPSGKNGNGNGAAAPNAHGLARIARRSVNGNGNGQPHLDLGYDPFVSIHIAAYNERRVIERLLVACAALNYANFEVILVDDSTDGSVEILDRWRLVERFKIIHRPNREGFKGGALQQALAATDPRAEYVVVFDADAIPFPDAIQSLLANFYTNGNGQPPRPIGEVAAVQGYQWHVLNKSESWLTEAVRTEYAGSYMVERPFQQLIGSMKMIAGTAYMVRADLLRQLGWGSSLTEDWELTLRLYELGYKVAYTPYAETPAECVATFGRLARQRMRWAEGHSHNVRRRFTAILRSPHLGRLEKLEFLYYSLYYLQSVFFVAGSLSWLASEIVLRTHVPAWTAFLGWSLLFSNLLALPVMNLGGLFIEGAPARDFGGVTGALATSFLLVPFQAWAALKGLFERIEGPWYRTPKTGRVTDPVIHLRRLKGLQRLLKRPAKRPQSPPRPAACAATPRRRPRRLGWALVAAMFAALVGIALVAFRAPVAYANPDQLYLRNAISTVNASDETLNNVGGSVGTTKHFTNGGITAFTWLSTTSYSGGSVGVGTYTFTFDWANNNCTSGAGCVITATWGFCNAGCLALLPPAATFTFDLKLLSGASGSTALTATGTPITLVGCPCNFYLNFRSTFGNPLDAFDLAYNGNTLLVNDTNIQTPALPVPERALAAWGVALLLPGLAYLASHRLKRRLPHAW